MHGTPCAVSVRLSLLSLILSLCIVYSQATHLTSNVQTVAGIISLINDFRLSQGSPTLGFLNPWLYGRPDGLYDITSGSNPGCGTTGFTAALGWDPVRSSRRVSSFSIFVDLFSIGHRSRDSEISNTPW